MLELSLTVEEDRTWYGARRGVSVFATLRPHNGGEIPLPYLLEVLATSAPDLIPPFGAPEDEPGPDEQEPPLLLTDRRGRPAEAFDSVSPSAAAAGQPDDEHRKTASTLRRLQEEELFYSQGVILPVEPLSTAGGSTSRSASSGIPRESLHDTSMGMSTRHGNLQQDPLEALTADESADLEAFTETPFVVRLHSRFEAFRGTRIVHRVVRTVSPMLEEIAPSLSVKMLARLIPARLDQVRLGVETFRPRRFSGMLGFVPSVSDRLYLELTRDIVRIVSQTDTRGSERSDQHGLTTSEQNVLERLDEALRRANLFPDLLSRIQGALQVRHP